MQKLLLVCCHSENRATSQIWKVLPNMVFRPIWGEKMASFWACACKLSWTLLSFARVQPLYGAGRKESSGTGLLFLTFKRLAKLDIIVAETLFLVLFPWVAKLSGNKQNVLLPQRQNEETLSRKQMSYACVQ